MKNKVFEYTKNTTRLVLVWYMLRSITGEFVLLLEEALSRLFVNMNTNSKYIVHLFSYLIDIAIICIYTLLVENRQVIYENKNQKFKKDDILLGVVIGGLFISSNIAIFYAFRTVYFTKGELSIFLLIYIIGNIILAFGEELIFRGYFLINIKNNKVYWIVISSLLFALSHEFELVNFIDQFIFGLVLGLIIVKRKNIILSTFLHATNNLFLINIFGTKGEDYYSLLYLKENPYVHVLIFDNGLFMILLRIILLLIIVFILFSNKKIIQKWNIYV